MDEDDRSGSTETPGGWRRPPIDERSDQARTWTPIAADALQHPALRTLVEAWWRAVSQEGSRPPSRRHFRPTDVVEALGRITVLERVPDHRGEGHSWKYRLVGTEVVTILQADITGETIDRFHRPLAEMLRTQFDAAAATGEPACYFVRTVVDHRPYAYEKAVLPVRSAAGATVDQLVVASFATDI
jgi:hypothetical protein